MLLTPAACELRARSDFTRTVTLSCRASEISAEDDGHGSPAYARPGDDYRRRPAADPVLHDAVNDAWPYPNHEEIIREHEIFLWESQF